MTHLATHTERFLRALDETLESKKPSAIGFTTVLLLQPFPGLLHDGAHPLRARLLPQRTALLTRRRRPGRHRYHVLAPLTSVLQNLFGRLQQRRHALLLRPRRAEPHEGEAHDHMAFHGSCLFIVPDISRFSFSAPLEAMDATHVRNSRFVLRLVLLLEDHSLLYLGATNCLFASMVEHCRWISPPAWGRQRSPDSPMRDRTCGPGYPSGFRPKGIWCLGEDTRHLWRLMCFADLNFLPSVQLHLPVPVVFACRRDLLSLWDLCRSVSCCGNRMFLVSVSLDLELFWSRGTRFAPWAPGRLWTGSWWKGTSKTFLDTKHLGLGVFGCDTLELHVCVLYPSKGSVKRRKILITLHTPSIDDGSYAVPLAIHGLSQQSPSFFTSNKSHELDQRCLVLADDPLGQLIVSRGQFSLFLAPQYPRWTFCTAPQK